MSEAPKKKRGRPKGSKSKKAAAKTEEPKAETPKEEPKVETPTEETTEVEKKEEPEKPKPKEYTQEEIEEIAKRVETPSDVTPPYNPKYVLSPEFKGTSNYEVGIEIFREEKEQKLASLKRNPDTNPQEIRLLEEDLKTLDYLYENFNIGMNVFRTAKGGRDKLRE